MPPRSHTLLPVLGLFGVAVILGAGHVCARFAFANGVNVLTAATVRSLLAATLLLALLRARRTVVLPLPREFRGTLVLGLFIAAQTVMIQVAVALLPVAIALLVFYTYPIFTGVASILLGDERFSWRLAATLVAAFVGLALVLGVNAQPVNPLGVAAALGASLSFTAAVVLTQRLAPGVGAPLRTFFMLATAAAVFVAAAVVTADVRVPAGGAGAFGLAGLAAFYAAGIIGLFLLLPLLGPVQTAIVLNLEPVVVAVIAWAALGEALTPTQILGAIMVVAAVMLFQVTARR
ncbi:MAG TPA: DMT family transporter [Burkholderiales bacterium]|nr:DMT family transporter [Burkholderiales bacterium]